VTVNELTGRTIKDLLEDVCDNLFNPDPYYQQGGDMVRVAGMRYTCTPGAPIGGRIANMTLNGGTVDAGRRYKVVSWAPVAEGASGEPVWELVAAYLRGRHWSASPAIRACRRKRADGSSRAPENEKPPRAGACSSKRCSIYVWRHSDGTNLNIVAAPLRHDHVTLPSAAFSVGARTIVIAVPTVAVVPPTVIVPSTST
jgi:hypothetical protein